MSGNTNNGKDQGGGVFDDDFREKSGSNIDTGGKVNGTEQLETAQDDMSEQWSGARVVKSIRNVKAGGESDKDRLMNGARSICSKESTFCKKDESTYKCDAEGWGIPRNDVPVTRDKTGMKKGQTLLKTTNVIIPCQMTASSCKKMEKTWKGGNPK